MRKIKADRMRGLSLNYICGNNSSVVRRLLISFFAGVLMLGINVRISCALDAFVHEKIMVEAAKATNIKDPALYPELSGMFIPWSGLVS